MKNILGTKKKMAQWVTGALLLLLLLLLSSLSFL
jgi:hypothetical protein